MHPVLEWDKHPCLSFAATALPEALVWENGRTGGRDTGVGHAWCWGSRRNPLELRRADPASSPSNHVDPANGGICIPAGDPSILQDDCGDGVLGSV